MSESQQRRNRELLMQRDKAERERDELEAEVARIEDRNLELQSLVCERLPECGPSVPLDEVNAWIECWNGRARAALAGEVGE